MFDISWIADLDAESACTAVLGVQSDLREHEFRELVLAAHWADLHGPESLAPAADTGAGWDVPGGERLHALGGPGTPEVAEFAGAELGLLMGVSPVSADCLIRDSLDLRHRHPQLWRALRAGRGRVWKARKVASLARSGQLSLEQAGFVDAETTPYVDSLTWSAFTRLVEAKIVEADPAAAEERSLAAEMHRFVSTGQSDRHGLTTLVARARAGDIIVFVAMCDRIAQILALEGDTTPVGARRAAAVGILANPALALEILARHAVEGVNDEPEPEPYPESEPEFGREPGPNPDHEPEPEPEPALGHECYLMPGQSETETGTDPETAVDGGADAGRAVVANSPCGTCGSRPSSRPGARMDPDLLRPKAVLVVRISHEALVSGRGIAVCENDGIGPVTAQAAARLLGHSRVTVRPVLDSRDQLPVDAYEVPAAMRTALRLGRPGSAFPWTTITRAPNGLGPEPDADHTRPYLPPARGGPPGQTQLDNLGLLTRRMHRLKTHARGWRMRQPAPGVYEWRTPHGYWFRVDRTGTHPLGQGPPPTAPSSSTAEKSPLIKLAARPQAT